MPENTEIESSGLPESNRTAKINRHKEAVSKDGLALKYVGERMRDAEMCDIAVRQNGWALEYVPVPLRTRELCAIAVASAGGTQGRTLSEVPVHLRDAEICKLAVQKDSGAMHYVPEPLRTPELCTIAGEQKPSTLDTLGLSGDAKDPSSDVGKALAEQQAGERKTQAVRKPT